MVDVFLNTNFDATEENKLAIQKITEIEEKYLCK